MSPDEMDLGVYLRGNEALYTALRSLISSRIEGRAMIPVPTDPVDCKVSLSRDSELRWLLGRLDFVYHSQLPEAQQDEQPAA